MATLTFTPTISATVRPDVTERYVKVFGTLAVSAAGDTYATDGAVTSFAGLVPQSKAPVEVEIRSYGPASGTLANIYRFLPGTTIANGKVMVLTTLGTAAGVQAYQELANGTAANATTNKVDLDQIYFRAVFRKGA